MGRGGTAHEPGMGVMDDFTWFVAGIAGGAITVLGIIYAAYKISIWRRM